jgi:hypothetical protein
MDNLSRKVHAGPNHLNHHFCVLQGQEGDGTRETSRLERYSMLIDPLDPCPLPASLHRGYFEQGDGMAQSLEGLNFLANTLLTSKVTLQ